MIHSGDWNLDGNWSSGAAPTSADDASIDSGLSASIATGVSAAGKTVSIGDAGTGSLSLSGGSLAIKTGVIGNLTGSSGTATVAGGTWTNSTDFNIGGTGTGELNITNGTVSSAKTLAIGLNRNSVGTATVDGATSTLSATTFFNVGYSGRGTLTVKNGGTVTSADTLTLGTNLNGNGTVSVTGAGSQLTATKVLNIGYEGTGALTVENGGVVTSADVVISVKTGTGTLNINSGGTLRTGSLFTGQNGAAYAWNMSGGTLEVAGQNLTTGLNVTLGDGTASAINTAGFSANLAGLVSGTGSLVKSGAGTLTLAGSNTFTGGTALSAGTLQTDSTTALGPATASLAVGSGTTLDLHGQSITLGVISGAGAIANTRTFSMSVLTVDSAADNTFSGGFSETATNQSLGLTKKGTGLLTLTGSSAYTAGTKVSAGTLTLTGPGAKLDGLATGNFFVGFASGDDGTLGVSNAATVSSSDFSVGKVLNSKGTTNVSGSGSSVSVSTLEVGDGGLGIMNVTGGAGFTAVNGAIGNSSGSVGTLTVTGSGSNGTVSSVLTVGASGTGVLNLQNGGAFETTDTTTIGSVSGSHGTLLVTDTGSTLQVGNILNIGFDGTGELDVMNGGAVTTTSSGTLGTNGTGSGTVTVDGAGSQWTAGALNIGYKGTGVLNVQNGGTVIATNGIGLGAKADGTGSGTINLNSGGILRTSNLYTANGSYHLNFGGGTLQAGTSDLATSLGVTLVSSTTSAVDTNGRNAELAGVVSGSGSLQKIGSGTLTLSGTNTYLGTTNVTAGTLRVVGIQTAATGNVTIGTNGTLTGTGLIGGNVTVSGALQPGDSVGNLTVAKLTLATGAVSSFDINSTLSFDRLTSKSTISLDGILDLVFSSVLTNNTTIDLFLGPATNDGNFSAVEVVGTAYTAGSFTQSGTKWTSAQGSQTLVFEASTGVLKVTAIPEPGVWTLLLLGLPVAVFFRSSRIARRS